MKTGLSFNRYFFPAIIICDYYNGNIIKYVISVTKFLIKRIYTLWILIYSE